MKYISEQECVKRYGKVLKVVPKCHTIGHSDNSLQLTIIGILVIILLGLFI